MPAQSAPAVTAQNMQSGDYYTLENITPDGFLIRFFNAADSGVARSFDHMAKGYGTRND